MKYYTAPEVAKITSKHPKTVAIALRSGELRGHQRAKGAHWLIDEDDVRAWVTGVAA